MNDRYAFAGPRVLAFTALFALRCGAPDQSFGAVVHLRVNQVGYRPSDPKVAVAMTNSDIAGRKFSVVSTVDGSSVYVGSVGVDRGRYGSFARVYELDFTTVRTPGTYRVRLDGNSTPSFAIKSTAYSQLIPKTLTFFQVQRCGTTDALLHGECHRKDGKAKDGPAAGSQLDVSGGWHDAGDYLKFVITTGFATNLMLTSYVHHPHAFADADGSSVPDLLDEIRPGIDWIRRMWDPSKRILYYQVGDESDHETWRMPEQDNNLPPRPVWACRNGKGANVAGKSAATLALAASIWNDPAASFRDPAFAGACLRAAKQIYSYGKASPAAQPSTSGFYAEETWKDDMALAAAELYRATKSASFLRDARAYAMGAGSVHMFYWDYTHGLAHYELASVDPSYIPHATTFLEADLTVMRSHAASNPYRAAVEAFDWGSAALIEGAALEALWYEELSGKQTFHGMAVEQRDYVLGANPWGVCWTNGVGTTWPRHPHHQVADITHSQLVGFWDEGPIYRAFWNSLNITLSGPDAYAPFQSDEALFHDDVADYGTNEPTLDSAALGIALTALMAP